MWESHGTGVRLEKLRGAEGRMWKVRGMGSGCGGLRCGGDSEAEGDAEGSILDDSLDLVSRLLHPPPEAPAPATLGSRLGHGDLCGVDRHLHAPKMTKG